MMRRMVDSIMAGFRFQSVTGFGIGKGYGEEKEREDNAKNVDHIVLSLLEMGEEMASGQALNPHALMTGVLYAVLSITG